jgi:hypothetical protein
MLPCGNPPADRLTHRRYIGSKGAGKALPVIRGTASGNCFLYPPAVFLRNGNARTGTARRQRIEIGAGEK